MSRANIIIGTDLSSDSDLAIDTGVEWAKKLSSDVTVMHIHDKRAVEDLGAIFPEFEKQANDLAKLLNQSIEDKLEKKVKPWKLKKSDLKTLVVYGDKIKSFLKACKDNKCKLLVMSLNNKEDDSFFYGKLVSQMIRLSPVPVLIVKDKRAIDPKTISFPFAFQGLSQDAASLVELISQACNAKIKPIHIIDDNHKKKVNPNESLNNISELESLYSNDESFHSMSSTFSSLEKLGVLDSLIIKTPLRKSSKELLLDTLNELGSDLIVMGSSGKSGFERLYLGSYCEFILRNTPSSILITKQF